MVGRRQFLGYLGATAIGAAAAACKSTREYDLTSLAQPELLSTLGTGEVRNIGQRYRALHASEASAKELRDAILGSLPLAARLGLVKTPISNVVRSDFEHGRTVIVDGWVLSVTEARQCALLSSLTA